MNGIRRLGVFSLALGVVIGTLAPVSHSTPAVDLSKRTSAPPPAGALEKLVLSEDVPNRRSEFSVSPDGRLTYFGDGKAYYVFDERGDLVHRIATKALARTLVPLPNGRFLSAQAHAGGHIALLAPDGTELRTLVARGTQPQALRADNTGWTSPTGIAFDSVHQLLFALDTTTAPTGTPDPNWSRVAVFDAEGKYLRQIAGYDGSKDAANDERRTWYDDIEVDPRRSLVYVTARATHELWAFDYEGHARGHVPGVAGIAVFANGDVAVGAPDNRHVRVYDSALRLAKTLDAVAPLDLEVDVSGRLYASVADQTVLYLRWPPSLSQPDTIRPKFRHISVDVPFDTAVAGKTLALRVAVRGRPTPVEDAWHVFTRRADGTDLSWRELEASYADGTLSVRTLDDQVGLYDLAVRYGKGAIDRANGVHDLHVQKILRFDRASEAAGSLTVHALSGRSAFLRGESIPVRIDATLPSTTSARVSLQHAGRDMASMNVLPGTSYWQLSSAFTRRLLPGHYTLNAAAGMGTPFEFDIAESEPTSPLQRILYHEFDSNPATLPQQGALDTAEQLAFIRDYINSVANLGFTRETDRAATSLDAKFAGVWRAEVNGQGSVPDGIPLRGVWQPEFYLDRATAAGVHYDTQLLSHCSPVRLADSWFPPLNGTLQRLSEWLGKYPSFYGFNYNDEIFFPNVPFVEALPADKAWLTSAEGQLHGRPKADIYRAGLARMYGEFDRAIDQVRPDLARTATPMWQYPAVEGSYAPAIYAHMSESYSHYLSEGYARPWYPAHSAEILRRPGLPLMAVFDNAYKSEAGESYLKNALQVLGRGVQGIGTEHHRPLKEAQASNALRLMNRLAEAYGSLFAQAEPDNEGAVLYSYSQDVTEHRDGIGTPHWERVQALHGAGLMAGLPLSIVYEEDVASDSLLDHGRPRVKWLFLVGQTAELPGNVKAALQGFSAAGGKVVVDAESRDFPGAIRFGSGLLGGTQPAPDVSDSDALFPAVQPAYEKLAATLEQQFGAERSFRVDTDDPWVSKNRFKAGAVHYVLLASETSPYPWDAPSTWALGGRYNKSYWPKQVNLSVPRTPVIYDVFDRRVVPTTTNQKQSVLPVDLKTFPGRLYALAPSELDAPKLRARLDEHRITFSVDVGLAARVPLRVALRDAVSVVSASFPATDLRGEFSSSVPRPLGAGPWRLEVSELLGGRSTSIPVPAGEFTEPWVRALPDVESEREPQIRALLGKSPRLVHLVAIDRLPGDLRNVLLQELKMKGVGVSTDAPSAGPSSSTYVVFGTVGGKGPGELTLAASQAGLFGRKLGDHYPGTGRGFVGAAFAPRTYGENCVAVVGGDQRGLELATRRFIQILKNEDINTLGRKPEADAPQPSVVAGAKSRSVDMPTLSERVGVRLSGILASQGKLVVAASGYLANLARVDDEGDHGQVMAVTRVGESPTATSLFLSQDGKSYGLAARTNQRFGEAFSLATLGSASSDVFSTFGDAAPFQHSFSASSDATTVLAPGPYGVVAWARSASGWRERWSIDYWKKFDALDWPVAADAARIPSFDTLVPRKGGIGLIMFGELTNDNWLGGGATSRAEVSARGLNDGAMRWQFTVPINGALVYPKLYASSDGTLVLVQAQVVGAGVFHYYLLDNGRQVSSWSSQDAPLTVDISDRTRRVAVAYGNGSRLLEVRAIDGHVVFSKTSHAQPLSTMFAEDGGSVFFSDDAGVLSRLNEQGELVWQNNLGCSVELARDGERLYTAGWDGRVRAFTAAGQERWKVDLTGPMSTAVSAPPNTSVISHEPQRASSASARVPKGKNLLRSGEATLTVGGTPGWKSEGKVEIDAATLTNGILDDATRPWLSPGELFWDATANRKVWAEVNFKQPTNVQSLTVYENSNFPGSSPTESLIEVWEEGRQRWRTVKHAVFLQGAVNTYEVNLQRVKRLRYLPWNSYFRNLYTSEIEVR